MQSNEEKLIKFYMEYFSSSIPRFLSFFLGSLFRKCRMKSRDKSPVSRSMTVKARSTPFRSRDLYGKWLFCPTLSPAGWQIGHLVVVWGVRVGIVHLSKKKELPQKPPFPTLIMNDPSSHSTLCQCRQSKSILGNTLRKKGNRRYGPFLLLIRIHQVLNVAGNSNLPT